MKTLRYEIWYSEGTGTDRYLCAEFETLDACQGYVEQYGSYHAQLEVIDTQTKRPEAA